MATWLVAIIGGSVGSIVTALLAWGRRLLRAREEVKAHDRFVAERDENLASWVSDRSLGLFRELNAASEEMSKKNLFYSSTHGLAISILKERALHEYRDQEREAQRDVVLVKLGEGRRHRFWRRGPFPELTTPQRAKRVLDAWRGPVKRHGTPPVPVTDMTKRNLDSALFEVEGGGFG